MSGGSATPAPLSGTNPVRDRPIFAKTRSPRVEMGRPTATFGVVGRSDRRRGPLPRTRLPARAGAVSTSPATPAQVWKGLARRLSPPGRDRMKVFDPETKQYARTRRLTDTLPELMAAAYLYTKGRTTLLALDFDTKGLGAARVDADHALALEWLTECGARVITDRSTRGGRHILVPLAIGTTASLAEVTALMRQLAARLSTLDPTPMLNAKEGCISVPGTRCSGGGHRILDGSLVDAIDAVTVRSDPRLLPSLYALLGTLPPTPGSAVPHDRPNATAAGTVGTGEHRRLAAHLCWTQPIAAAVTLFATTGAHTARRSWRGPSEARMSVVLNAVLRGATTAELRARSAPGQPWSALGDNYRTKYGPHAAAALARDVDKALDYAASLAAKANPTAHRKKSSQPQGARDGPHARWLAYAWAWADREFAGSPLRWTVRDVYQALAIKAVLAGRITAGTPVVGVWGRALSLSAGLMPATTVFEILRRTRDMPGAPIVRVRPRYGRDADHYALTASNPDQIRPVPLDRVTVADVHPAWSVLGRHHRAVYELIAHTGLTRSADVYAAARLSPRSGQLAITALTTAGLIVRTSGALSVGRTTLDDVAAAHHLADVQADRIARYRRERAAWHAWLAIQEQLRDSTPDPEVAAAASTPPDPDEPHHAEYLAAVLAHGPPPDRQDHHDQDHDDGELFAALDVLAIHLGARVLTATAV